MSFALLDEDHHVYSAFYEFLLKLSIRASKLLQLESAVCTINLFLLLHSISILEI